MLACYQKQGSTITKDTGHFSDWFYIAFIMVINTRPTGQALQLPGVHVRPILPDE